MSRNSALYEIKINSTFNIDLCTRAFYGSLVYEYIIFRNEKANTQIRALY